MLKRSSQPVAVPAILFRILEDLETAHTRGGREDSPSPLGVTQPVGYRGKILKLPLILLLQKTLDTEAHQHSAERPRATRAPSQEREPEGTGDIPPPTGPIPVAPTSHPRSHAPGVMDGLQGLTGVSYVPPSALIRWTTGAAEKAETKGGGAGKDRTKLGQSRVITTTTTR